MATLKGISRSKRSESLRGSFMVDTVRGVLRVRKWPKKRGTPKSEKQRWWNSWFKQANLLAKYVDAATARRAIEITAGSGMYPRDIILSAMRGRLYTWQDQTGKVWYSMAAIQDISESLDVLAQAVGSVLVRAVDRWRPPGPETPTIGHALTYQGPTTPPIWAESGAGVAVQPLAGSPITCDNTQNEYLFDVTGYAEATFTLDNVGFAASDFCQTRVSIDGGATYKSGAADYRATTFSASGESSGTDSALPFVRSGGATGHVCCGTHSNLRAGRVVFRADVAQGATKCGRRMSFATFDGPITHIKLYAFSGNNFNAGAIYATGIVAS